MILEAIERLVPDWMFDEGRRHYGVLMQGIAVLLDAAADAIGEARKASMPAQVDIPGIEGLGGFDSVDALPLVGRDRSIRQGLTEPPWDYAGRVRRWLEAWARSATAPELLDQLAAILGPSPPILRIVDTFGSWWTRYTDGSFDLLTQTADGFHWVPATGEISALSDIPHAWDWDSVSAPPPPDQDDDGRFWLVIYAPCNLPYLAGTDLTFDDDGTLGDFALRPGVSGAGIGPDAGTVGAAAPWKLVELVRNLIQEWRTMGVPCKHVIVTFDPDSFNPLTDSTPTSVPDGKWGWHSWHDVGTNTRLPGRFPNAEYWPGTPGGVH